MKRQKLFITSAIIIISIILAVISWFILPDEIAVQITMSGSAGNTVPKIFGILLPLLLSVPFSISFYKKNEKKHLIYSIIGVVIAIVFLIFNK